jgi:hypothetical protein
MPPPAAWAPQPPPYAAPPGWQPPPPPYGAGTGHAGYPAPNTWQPASPGGSGQLPYGWTPPYPQARGTNGFCIASFILAVPPICALTLGLGSLLGLIFGIVGLRQVRHDGQRGRGLAIAGVIMGGIGVVIGVLVVIAAVVGAAHGSGGSGGSGGSANTVSTLGRLPG